LSKKLQTDWDLYYSKPYAATTFSRKITGNILINYIRKYTDKLDNLSITELGGANSCFYELIEKEIAPHSYYVIDNNELGLQKLEKRLLRQNGVYLYKDNVLDLKQNLQVDLSFSVGLIEHFSLEDTKKAIKAHFEILKPDGIAIISFPTPTLLYKTVRLLSELLGMWIFYDERPITLDEVMDSAVKYGAILDTTVIYPILLTQCMLVIKKFGDNIPLQKSY
jgi:SAM-dependent methyltransferase